MPPMHSMKELLNRALTFRPKPRPRRRTIDLYQHSPTLRRLLSNLENAGLSRRKAKDLISRAGMSILTPDEVAARLKVPVSWVYEKSRTRCPNPIPCLRIGRYIRFDWTKILEWLESNCNRVK